MNSSGKPTVIRVCAGAQTYPVFLGAGFGKPLYQRALSELTPSRVFLVIDSNFFVCQGRKFEQLWRSTGKPVEYVVIPSGERYKCAASVEKLHDWLIAARASCSDIIVACGGGVTSDLVGYAAGTLFRGVRWGICATTLLSMADASIGGKTGINHPSGKNLIGLYWQPSFVIDDLDWLSTLAPREFRSGAAEIIKCAGLSGGKLLRLVDDWSLQEFSPEYPRLNQIVEVSIRYKASVVARDERDAGVRMALNFGHTVGHAIEQSLSYKRLTHGEAVILGMIAALKAGEESGLAASDTLVTFKEVLRKAASHLPRVRLSLPKIMDAIKSDKKRVAETNRFVLLRRAGQPVVREISRYNIKSAVSSMLKEYHLL